MRDQAYRQKARNGHIIMQIVHVFVVEGTVRGGCRHRNAVHFFVVVECSEVRRID